jgi:hypothetical protein
MNPDSNVQARQTNRPSLRISICWPCLLSAAIATQYPVFNFGCAASIICFARASTEMIYSSYLSVDFLVAVLTLTFCVFMLFFSSGYYFYLSVSHLAARANGVRPQAELKGRRRKVFDQREESFWRSELKPLER